MKIEILNMVKKTIAEVEDYVRIFEEYEYIWLDDKQEHLTNVITISDNYFAIERSCLFIDIELQQFKDKSITLFSEQVNSLSVSLIASNGPN